MNDYTELKRLAENALGDWFESGELRYEDRSGYMNGLHHDDEYFIEAANPATVLALIADRERLERAVSEALGLIDGQTEILYQRRHMIGQLESEVESLRKDAERYRWLRDKDQLDPRYQHEALTIAFADLTGGALDGLVDSIMRQDP